MLMLFLQKLTHNTMKRNVAVSSLSQINPAEIALAFGGQQPPYESIHVAKRDVQPPPIIGEDILTNRKTGSQCPGSQSQTPITPSLWLLNNCSHV